MEETYNIDAIITRRLPFREHDLQLTVYSAERGRQVLVARGARKFQSKIAAHVEPFNRIQGLVVRGKGFDYLGSAISLSGRAQLKNDIDRLFLVGEAVRLFNQVVTEAETEVVLFELLDQYLQLNSYETLIAPDLLFSVFLGKLLFHLGYATELYSCTQCQKPLTSSDNKIISSRRGVVCNVCQPVNTSLSISDTCIKLWRLVITQEFSYFKNIITEQSVIDELCSTIRAAYHYL